MGEAATLPFLVTHPSHNTRWLVASSASRHGQQTPVCIACFTEMLDDRSLVSIKKKIALTELVSLFQQDHVTRLLLANQDAHLHLTFMLTGYLHQNDPTLSPIAAEGLIKLLAHAQCRNTALQVVDVMIKQCLRSEDYTGCVPILLVLARLFEASTSLVQLVHEKYAHFLDYLIKGLPSSDEKVQASLLVVLLRLAENDELSTSTCARLLPHVLVIMVNARTTALRMSAVALLKCYTSEREKAGVLMNSSGGGLDLASAVKHVLINAESSLRTTTVQCLSHLLSLNQQYATQLLNNDIAELLFESLATSDELLLRTVFGCLDQLCQSEDFYIKHHSIYGIESILRGIDQTSTIKSSQAAVAGLQVVTTILERHRANICLFSDLSRLNHCLRVITSGIGHSAAPVRRQAVHALVQLYRVEHFPGVVPFSSLNPSMLSLHQNLKNDLDVLQRHLTSNAVNNPTLMTTLVKIHRKVEQFITLLERAAGLIVASRSDGYVDEAAFMAPDKVEQTPVDEFCRILLQSTQCACIPLVVILYQYCGSDSHATLHHLYTLLTRIYSMNDEKILQKMSVQFAKTDFISFTLLAKRDIREPSSRACIDHVLCCILRHLSAIHVYQTESLLKMVTNGIADITGVRAELLRIVGLELGAETLLEKQTTCLLLAYYLTFYAEEKFDVAEGVLVMSSLALYVVSHGGALMSSSIQCVLYLWAVCLSCMQCHNYSRQEIKALSLLVSRLSSDLEKFCPPFLLHPIVLWFSFTKAQLAQTLGAHVLRYRLEQVDDDKELQSMAVTNPICMQTLLELLLSSELDVVTRGVALLERVLSAKLDDGVDSGYRKGLDENITLIAQRMFLAGDKAGLKDHNREAMFDVLTKLRSRWGLLSKPHSADLKLIHHVQRVVCKLAGGGEVRVCGEKVMESYLRYLSCLLVQSLVTDDFQGEMHPVALGSQKVCSLLLAQNDVITGLGTMMTSQHNGLMTSSTLVTAALIEMDRRQQNAVRATCIPIPVELASLLQTLHKPQPDLKIVTLLLVRSLYLSKLRSCLVEVKVTATPGSEVKYQAERMLYNRLLGFVVQEDDQLLRTVALCVMETMVEYYRQMEDGLGDYLYNLPWNRRLLKQCALKLANPSNRITCSDCHLLDVFFASSEMSSVLPVSVCQRLVTTLLTRLVAADVGWKEDLALASLIDKLRNTGWFPITDYQKNALAQREPLLVELANAHRSKREAGLWLDSLQTVLREA